MACEYFVNGVEWGGNRFGMSETETGTVLAAFGNALPESTVTFVAVVFGQDAAHKEIGVGAALGGPLVLATIAYSVVGFAFMTVRHTGERRVVSGPAACRLLDDQRWSLAIFVCKVGLGVVAFTFKPWLGVFFPLAYEAYVWREMTASGEKSESADEPLKLTPRAANPRTVGSCADDRGARGDFLCFAAVRP